MSQQENGASGTESRTYGREPDAATVSATRDQSLWQVVRRHALFAAIMAIAVAGLAALR